MNSWAIFAFSAALSWAIVNVLDKLIVDKRVNTPGSFLMLNAIVGLFPATIILFLFKLDTNIVHIFISVLSGILDAWFVLIYYTALKKGNVSVVGVAIQSIPIFSTIIGFIFLHERLSFYTYLGIIVIIFGLVLASLEYGGSFRSENLKILGLMLPAALIGSISYALQSYVLDFTDVNSLFAYARIGHLVFGCITIVLFSTNYTAFTQSIKVISISTVVMIFFIEMINLTGVYFITLAYSNGPLAMVSTLSSTQTIFIIFITFLISKIFPSQKYLYDKKYAVNYLASALFVLIGIYFIST